MIASTDFILVHTVASRRPTSRTITRTRTFEPQRSFSDTPRARSNHIIQRVGVLALEFADAVAELSEGDGLENPYDGVADFLHDTANTAVVFVRAGAAFV